VEASDVHDYGAGFPVDDYLFGPEPSETGFTITNPPFRLAEQFIERALRSSLHGAAVIVRSAFLEGIGRQQRLFSKTPPSTIGFADLFLSPRLHSERSNVGVIGKLIEVVCDARLAQQPKYLRQCLLVHDGSR
jgi:hypothetical protein